MIKKTQINIRNNHQTHLLILGFFSQIYKRTSIVHKLEATDSLIYCVCFFVLT